MESIDVINAGLPVFLPKSTSSSVTESIAFFISAAFAPAESTGYGVPPQYFATSFTSLVNERLRTFLIPLSPSILSSFFSAVKLYCSGVIKTILFLPESTSFFISLKQYSVLPKPERPKTKFNIKTPYQNRKYQAY